VAFVSQRDEERPQLFLIPATGGEAKRLSQFPEGAIGEYHWSPDGQYLAVCFRATETEWTAKETKRRAEQNLSDPPRVLDDPFYRLDGDGYFNGQRFALFVVEVATGKQRRLFSRGRRGVTEFGWSPCSTELVVVANTSRQPWITPWKDDLYRVDLQSGKSRRIQNLPTGSKQSPVWSPDGDAIAYAGHVSRQLWGSCNLDVFVCNADCGEAINITRGEDYCLGSVTLSDTAEASFGASLQWTPDGKNLVMNFGWQGASVVATVPAAGGRVKLLTPDDKTVLAGNLSRDGRRLAVTVNNVKTLPEAGVCCLSPSASRGKLEQWSNFNADILQHLELGPVESHWIDSTDGTRVHTWIMKPPGFQKKKMYPAVIQVHGGPHTQYGCAFFHEFRVLAASGYVVVYSNPRGSKGYGESHCDAIRGAWGQKDWADVQAVAEFARAQAYVDPQRLGIMGGSYGGYMTNWAIGHSDEFAAAVTDRCVSNLVSMAGSSDVPLVTGDGYWAGNAWDDTNAIWDQSPMQYMGRVRTPTLIIHSEGDLRCNVEQSEQVFAALQTLGVPSRFVRYPRSTSHGMSRCGPPDLRIHRLGQILDWLNEFLKPADRKRRRTES
jgi:dipeptidyl aminopeptidase/acylaminoacyl peptidase